MCRSCVDTNALLCLPPGDEPLAAGSKVDAIILRTVPQSSVATDNKVAVKGKVPEFTACILTVRLLWYYCKIFKKI